MESRASCQSSRKRMTTTATIITMLVVKKMRP